MGISSQGTTFSFTGITATYTSISVEEATPEIVNMTAIDDPVATVRMVSTGAYTAPAKVKVDYIRASTTPQPLTMSGLSGVLTIAHANVAVSENAIIESATSEIAVGNMLRGTLNFVIDNS